jgi:arginyl-tRNA--protein-N-Asp/Glu arginylyltransferase
VYSTLDTQVVSIERRNFPQFFITAPSPCPYLPDRMERKVFTHLVSVDAKGLNTQLSKTGFRRSQNIAYRPACDNCQACTSVRVPVSQFVWSKSFQRVLKRNADLAAEIVPARATQEHYSLFRDYVDTRHGEGGMADMAALDFAAMIDESVVDSRVVEYRKTYPGRTQPGELVAAVLIDKLSDGLSLIYSFYDPTETKRSLGTFIVLDAIRKAAALGLTHVYLGYLIKESPKMSYKQRFVPQERLSRDGWKTFFN